MSHTPEPTNEQLYETYPPSVHEPGREMAVRGQDSLDQRLDRIEAALAGGGRTRPSVRTTPGSGPTPGLALAIVSVVMGVPLTAITMDSGGGFGTLMMLLVVWFGLVGVNVAFNMRNWRRPPD